MKIKFKPFYAFLLMLPVVVWLYNPFQLFFLNDDAIYIPQNQNFFNNKHLTSRILSDFSLFIDSWLYGKKAWGYHLTNLLLHLVCTSLVYFFARKCALAFHIEKPKETAALASFIFLIYAFHSEAVLWIIGRGGSLSTAFAGLSLILFLIHSKSKWYYLLSLLSFAAGLSTYESIWVLPILISLLALVKEKRDGAKKEFVFVSGYWLIFIFFLIIRKVTEGAFARTPYGVADTSMLSDVRRYAYNLAALILRSFLPPATTSVFVISSIVFLLAVVAVVWILFKRGLFSPFRTFIYVAFLICLLPYVMFGIDTHDSESERFLYLPSVFTCLILADLILLINSRGLRLVVIVFVTLFHLFFLYQTSASYKQSSRIAKTTFEALQGYKGAFETVYLIDVPTQYKGAFVFRIGFYYILKWLAPEVRYHQLVEVSSREIVTPVENFSALMTSLNSDLFKPLKLQEKIGAVNKKKNDRIFLWSDSSFVIIY